MKTKDRKKQNVLIVILLILIMVIVVISNKSILKKETTSKIQTSLVSTENLNAEEEVKIEENITQNPNVNEAENTILTTYQGYPVIAKLEIPKIDLETYVISEYSKQALGVSVTKFYGGNPNEVGNFCIAGHNYVTKNMFHDLKKLSIGDTFTLIDGENQKCEYKIYLINTVNPNETQCLSQKTNGRIEVTLITCTTDSSKRIIIKAVKI